MQKTGTVVAPCRVKNHQTLIDTVVSLNQSASFWYIGDYGELLLTRPKLCVDYEYAS